MTRPAATAELPLHLPIDAPIADPREPLARLADATCWVGAPDLACWSAATGDAALLVAGDPVRFPEGLDVAVILPEIRRALDARFAIGVVRPEDEDDVARRFGATRRPSIVFLRSGAYVATVAGVHDWPEFVDLVRDALSAPISRPPTVGIPVVDASADASHCA